MKKILRVRGIIMLAVCLTAAAAFALLPGPDQLVCAADGNETSGSAAEETTGSSAITEGTGALGEGTNTADARIVYMGGKAWYLIGNDGEGVVSSAGTMTFLSVKNLATGVLFNGTANLKRNNEYGGSTIRERVDSFAASLFTDEERSNMVARDLPVSEDKDDSVTGEEVKDTALWLLSRKEAAALDPAILTVPIDKPDHSDWQMYCWWLRSPGAEAASNQASLVTGDGEIILHDIDTNWGCGVRPAFVFKKDNILFASAGETGKSSGDVGPNALQKVGSFDGREWKLTLKDRDHAGFRIEEGPVKNEDGTLGFTYTGVPVGNNEYISAVIKNSEGEITAYGRVKQCGAEADTAGSFTVDTFGFAEEGDTIGLFSEQLSGEGKTDYASELYEFTVPRIEEPWEFTGFEWIGNEDNGYRSAAATYRSTANEGHVLRIDAEIIDEMTEEETCTENGTTSYLAKVEDVTAPDGIGRSESRQAAVPQAIGHDWKPSTCTKPEACANCGERKGEAPGHQWRDWKAINDEVHKHVCSVCGESETADHEWEEKVLQPASENADGAIEFTCSVCGRTKTVVTHLITGDMVRLSSGKFTYNGQVQVPEVAVMDVETAVAAEKYEIDSVSSVDAGQYTITVRMKEFDGYTGTVTKKYQIAKAGQPMAVKAVPKKVKAKKLRKKACRISGTVKFTKRAAGKVTYKGKGTTAKARKALKINKKTGKITVRKNTKRGTYRMKVRVKASGDRNHAGGSRSVIVTVRVR